MLSSQAIAELRLRTGVSSLDAVHALSVCEGRIEPAIAFLLTPQAPAKILHVPDSCCAARLAESLIRSGLWFECEQLGREAWRFAVAPAGYAQLLRLYRELAVESNAKHGERVISARPGAQP